jgi:hypothetical protein
MAKKSGAVVVATGLAPPPSNLPLSTKIWSAGVPLHRIHLNKYAPNGFNLGKAGNARFSPIADAAGKAIPTIYGGSTFECAAMETVFHDVPFSPGFKSYDKLKLENQVHSVLIPKADILLADLSNPALRKLGVKRADLIDTEKDRYPQTRMWAQAIHSQNKTIQGLCWVSRQDDRALSVMLFGDRVTSVSLVPGGPSRYLNVAPGAYDELLDLAELIGVSLVPGHP